jgi:hypothetical protein
MLKQGLSRQHYWICRGVFNAHFQVSLGVVYTAIQGCTHVPVLMLFSSKLRVIKKHTDSEQYLRSRGAVRDPRPGQLMGYLEPCLGIATAQECM